MTRLLTIAVLSGLLPFMAGASEPPPTGLRWPLAIPGRLLSSFGEYRYDHLHAGIDISTSGGTGHRVHAAASGSIYRLKVEWRGYGRALYIRHPDGKVTVYGHLERFEDATLRLEQRVARRQVEAGTRYPGDIYLDPPLPVRRGQVIAYSGESGAGLPHLHFEVRRGEEAPIDPFAAGLPRPPDGRPPVLEEIVVTAARDDVFIDGTLRERFYPLHRRDGLYRTDGPIRVSGPFLLALLAHDPAEGGGHSGLRTVRASVDGRPRYELNMRTFRFEQYPQAGLLYDHRFSGLGPARYAYRLARLPGNDLAAPFDTLPIPEGTHPGAFDLAPGTHLLDIAGEDSAGNRSRARLCVLVGAPPAPTLPGRAAGETGRSPLRFAVAGDDTPRQAVPRAACPVPELKVEGGVWSEADGAFRPIPCRVGDGLCVLDGADGAVARLRQVRHGVPGPWMLASLRDPGPSPKPPGGIRFEAWPAFLDILTLPALPPPRDLQLVTWPGGAPVARLEYRDGLVAGAGIGYERLALAGPLSIIPPPPRGGGVQLPDVRLARRGEETRYVGPGFEILIPRGGRFYTGPLAVRTERVPGSPALPAVSEAVEILPAGEALRERGTLRFEITGAMIDLESLGIYRWDARRERWAYEGGEVQAGRPSVSVGFRRYGRFALLQDASPPVIVEVEPREGAVVGRRPQISARVEEEGEGLGFDGVAFELDGVAVQSEFDPDRGRSTVLPIPPLRAGPHRLRVVATDTAGNMSDPVEVSFTSR